jgi:hypothetical protein
MDINSSARERRRCCQSINGLPELSRHFLCVPEYGYRLIGLGMKQHVAFAHAAADAGKETAAIDSSVCVIVEMGVS